MADPPRDPEPRRRPSRPRIWIGALVALAASVAVVLILARDDGGGSEEPRIAHVPYGEIMSSAEYEAIDEGEERATVLERLDKTGRPESLTKPYVLVLFPPTAEGVECTYWEFSDEPEIFARLCFDTSSGELVQKLERNVHEAGEPAEGTSSV